MKLPNALYIRGVSTTPGGGVSTTPTFAMIPAEVLFDPRMDHRDLRVYAAMVYFRAGDGGEVGERRLSGACRIDRRSLKKVFQRLAVFGHVSRVNDGLSRGKYSLTAPLFKAERAATSVIESAAPNRPSVQKRDLVACPTCRKRVGGLLKVGWCRSCNHELKTRRLVREEIAKLA